MSHMIEISDETFAQMQALATPLVDTPDTLVARALRALASNGRGRAQPMTEPTVNSFNPAVPPSLSHTTPKSMILCGARLPKPETYWNSLMIAVIREAARRGMTADEIDRKLIINSLVGRKEDNGYKYLSDVGISVQGQDANAAWRQAYDIASELGLAIEVEFTWQNSPKAAMPNATGRFSVGGS